MSYIPYTTSTSLEEVSSTPSQVCHSPGCSAHWPNPCPLLRAAGTSQPAAHSTHRGQLDAIWWGKAYSKSQQPGLGRANPHQESERSLIFNSLYMEMVVLVLQIDPVPSLCLHQCLGLWHAAPEASARHPPSQTCSLYITGRKVLGAAKLPFSSEQNFQMWHCCWGKSKRKCSHSHGELGALDGAGPQTGPFFLQGTQLGFLRHPLPPKTSN